MVGSKTYSKYDQPITAKRGKMSVDQVCWLVKETACSLWLVTARCKSLQPNRIALHLNSPRMKLNFSLSLSKINISNRQLFYRNCSQGLENTSKTACVSYAQCVTLSWLYTAPPSTTLMLPLQTKVLFDYLVICNTKFIIKIQSIAQTLKEHTSCSYKHIFRRFPERILFLWNFTHIFPINRSLVMFLTNKPKFTLHVRRRIICPLSRGSLLVLLLAE